jgi:hypothetical protein
MRLTAFHTPDGIYYWNRLLMGAKPSSAVQQSAYLEALDDYIDYYEDGTLRKCLLDEHGHRLKDAEGNLKTLRHKFAVYCDDICAGADTLEELYELFEALICCCKRAGIQVKASKTKFGMDRITFHNYTISREGTQPKDANLCPIRNMSSLSDVSQVRAFLGCCCAVLSTDVAVHQGIWNHGSSSAWPDEESKSLPEAMGKRRGL